MENTNVAVKKKERNSSLELLRIIATLMVIFLHYNNSSIGGGFKYAATNAHYNVLLVYEMLAICAVNIFVLLSGYFMSNSKKVDISKPLLLFAEVVVFRIVRYFISIIFGSLQFKFSTFLNQFIPVNWYVSIYVALYMLTPFLNKLVRELNTKRLGILVLVSFVLFSIWPTVIDGVEIVTDMSLSSLNPISTNGGGSGYTIVNFVLLYLLGAYLKRTSEERNARRDIVIGLTIYAASTVLLVFIGTFKMSFAISYCNPLVILQAAALTRVFAVFNIKSRLINLIASCSFGVYLLHKGLFRFLNIKHHASSGLMATAIYPLASAIAVYIVCALIYFVYSKTLRRLLLFLFKKLSFIGYEVE